MNITFKNITIRNAFSDDATTLCRWWNDGAVMAHAGFPNGVNTTVETIKQSLLKDVDSTHRRHIIFYDQIPIGETNYRNLGDGVAELGIKICETDYQNKGLGKIILSMIIDGLFHQLGYQKIVLDTNTNNIRAQKTYLALGFKQVRVRLHDWVDGLGNSQSAIDYELTIDQFINYCK